MKAPEIPSNEAMRLAALWRLQILDTAAEQRESLIDLASMVSDELTTFVDDLTGITNRRGLKVAIKALSKQEDHPLVVTLALFDLDDFKQINDRYGHVVGDRALRNFAHLMADVFRSTDFVCRLGGDEFCVLLTKSTEVVALSRINDLRDRVEHENKYGGEPYSLQFSSGIYTNKIDQHDQSIIDIIKEADRQLYVSKAKHKQDTETCAV